MAGVRYLRQAKARIEILKGSCRLNRNNATLPNHEEDGDANPAYQIVILRIWRHQNVKCTYLSFQPCVGYEFDELCRPSGVSEPCLSEHVAPIQAEEATMLLNDIALVDFALTLGA